MATLDRMTQKIVRMSPQNTTAYTDLQEARNAVKTKMAEALIEIKNMQVRAIGLPLDCRVTLRLC